MIRVLAVDDSVVIRKVVSSALDGLSDMAVVATAATGRIALQKLAATQFDAVVLDVEMPDMDGLTALTEIRSQYPHLPVIMFSTLTQLGAETTVEALYRGASDYLAKPTGQLNADASFQYVRKELARKIRAVCKNHEGPASSIRPEPEATHGSQLQFRSSRRLAGSPSVLAIGSSTGGPQALNELLQALAPKLTIPVVITQHMPGNFIRPFANRLTTTTGLAVSEAKSGALLEPRSVWLAPGEHHMMFRRSGTAVQVHLDDGPPENSCRPAVDPMFRSLAKVFGPDVLGIVLTGMGHDGSGGARSIVESGGSILVQDEASSVVWGMPGFVAREGLAEAALPVAQLAAEVVLRCRRAPAGLRREEEP